MTPNVRWGRFVLAAALAMGRGAAAEPVAPATLPADTEPPDARPPAAASPPVAQPHAEDAPKRLGRPFPAPVQPPPPPDPPDVHVGVVSPQPSPVFERNVHPGNQRRRLHGDPHQSDDDQPPSGMDEPAAPDD